MKCRTKSVDPKRLAVWSFKDLHARLGEYLYEIYDSRDHPALGQTPREAYGAGLAQSGHRLHRIIPYDREFLIHTLPAPRQETAKVVPGRGIKVHYLFYWCDLFRDPQVEKTRVAVRYDPFDAGSAFAFVQNRWTECHSEYYAVFRDRSEREVMLASHELRKRQQNYAQRFSMTARKLAEFLQSVEAQEKLLVQRLSDQEVRRACPPSSLACGNNPAGKISEPPERIDPQDQKVCLVAQLAQQCETYGEL